MAGHGHPSPRAMGTAAAHPAAPRLGGTGISPRPAAPAPPADGLSGAGVVAGVVAHLGDDAVEAVGGVLGAQPDGDVALGVAAQVVARLVVALQLHAPRPRAVGPQGLLRRRRQPPLVHEEAGGGRGAGGRSRGGGWAVAPRPAPQGAHLMLVLVSRV